VSTLILCRSSRVIALSSSMASRTREPVARAKLRNALARLQRLARHLGGLEDRNGRLTRAGAAGDELMPIGPHHVLLHVGEVDHDVVT
jgi:hypothetical protein